MLVALEAPGELHSTSQYMPQAANASLGSCLKMQEWISTGGARSIAQDSLFQMVADRFGRLHSVKFSPIGNLGAKMG